MKDIAYIGKTTWRNQGTRFGIKDKDRLGHVVVIGRTGSGKSTLMLNMAVSDIDRGHGVCVIDPHGDLAEAMLNYIPLHRIPDVIYFDAGNNNSYYFNPLNTSESNDLVASGIVTAFEKLWASSWGPRLEHILRHSILTLLYYPSATLLDIQPLLTDKLFREMVLSHVTDQPIRAFWYGEFDRYTASFRSEAIAPILNKVGVLNASLPLRRIFGHQQSSFTISEVMQTKKVLVCNLAKGVIGTNAANVLGGMLLSAIQTAALGRTSLDPKTRTPFFVYIDEAHTFLTKATIDMLSEMRKFGVGVLLAHQYLEQLSEDLTAAIFGNVGTVIAFRVGARDAEILAREFTPVFSAEDCITLPKYQFYIKLLIDGTTSRPFSAESVLYDRSITSNRSQFIQPKSANPVTEIRSIRQAQNFDNGDDQLRLFKM